MSRYSSILGALLLAAVRAQPYTAIYIENSFNPKKHSYWMSCVQGQQQEEGEGWLFS